MKIEGVIYKKIVADKTIVAKKLHPSKLISLKSIKAQKVKDACSSQ